MDDDLARATAALLAARGQRDLARLLERGALRQLPGAETWSIGGRQVTAVSFALVLLPADYVAFEALAGASDATVEAVRNAIAGPSTALKDLFVLVALTPALEAWSTGYRSAPPQVDEAPGLADLVATAASYLRARGEARGAAILDGARLDRARMANARQPELYRYVVQVTAEDLALLDRDAALRDAVVGAIDVAARRASERAGSVELSLRPVLA